MFIAQDCSWANGYLENVNGKLRDRLLDRQLFLSLDEVCWMIGRWRPNYNHHRPHSALDHQTPAAFAAGCILEAEVWPKPEEHS